MFVCKFRVIIVPALSQHCPPRSLGFCDIKTPSLASPELAREAMLLAAKQYRDRLLLAPSAVGGMNRGAAAAAAGGSASSSAAGPSDGGAAHHVAVGGGMVGRLTRLTQLAQRGVLTAEQVGLGEVEQCVGGEGGGLARLSQLTQRGMLTAKQVGLGGGT